MMLDLMYDVSAFHSAMECGPDAIEPLTDPPAELVKLRAKLIAEEFIETIYSMVQGRQGPADIKAEVRAFNEAVDEACANFDLLACADGLADLIYVCVGAALAFGIPLDRVWAEVQRANMAKGGGERRADGKIGKPEGWTPPDIHRAIFGEAA